MKARACSIAGTVCAGVAILSASGTVLAQQSKFDFGKREYGLHCALCHGLTGKGDGPYSQTVKRPSDLTVLSKANKGVFPYQRVREVIDGRKEIEAHGTRDMPIWGSYYQAIDIADSAGVSHDSEKYVLTRISALIDYLNRMQAR
jgi:mono/diheme cytochrome c family protein